MRATLVQINQMQGDGVIGRYAIGGAVGPTFYLEPAATLDIDIFVTFPPMPAASLVSLSSIHDYLIARGCTAEGEHIVIDSWPVRFLPAANALEQEALLEARQTEVEGTPTWVMTAEHLVAIALRTSRPKDRSRIMQFIEQGAFDRDKLREILERHGLRQAWERFERRYLDDINEQNGKA